MIYFFTLICAQIILESFPVSSSGHIVLIESFFNNFFTGNYFLISSDKIFCHFLHGPTVFVIALFFLNRWMFLLKNIRRCWHIILKLTLFVVVADGITFLYFLFFSKVLHTSFFPVGLGFVISALALFSLKCNNDKKRENLDLKKVAIIGTIQGISLLPGISRFGLTFASACWLGINPKKSFEFSFALQWPLIAAGFLESIILIPNYNGCNNVNLFSFNVLLILFFASLIAFFSLAFVEGLIKTNRIWVFSIFLLFSFVAWLII